MDVNTIISHAEIIMRVANLAMKAGADMAPFIKSAYQVIVKKQPLAQDQRAALLAEENRLRAILQQPETDDD